MNPAKIALKSFVCGAAVMYLFDPDRGRRRRAGVRDKAVKAFHGFSSQLDKAGRDLSNRAQGVWAGTKSMVETPDLERLAERVRSRMGRVISHPHAIEVRAEEGTITLMGPILENEQDKLLRAVRGMRGVRSIDNRLSVHSESEHIPSLQGGARRSSLPEVFEERWTPALRIGAGTAGAALIFQSMRTKGSLKILSGIAGSALLARSISNRELIGMVGAGRGNSIQFEKTVHVQAPVDEVFAFWNNYENFPRFMAHLKEVRDLGNGKSHWVAEGPAGVPISWDAEISQSVANQLLEWQSVADSLVRTHGTVRFDANSSGGTRISIHLCYRPPAGMLGHVVASLFGASPKQEMDDDMVRLKSLLELGKTRAHGLTVRRDQLVSPGPPARAE